jgi:rRNA maturation endonuclease Nob1
VDILVADEDYENAVQVLKDNDSWPEELTLCPYCGSSDIQLVLRKEKRWRAMGAAIISALMVIPPGDNHWNYTCKQCHKTFEMPVSKFDPSAVAEE